MIVFGSALMGLMFVFLIVEVGLRSNIMYVCELYFTRLSSMHLVLLCLFFIYFCYLNIEGFDVLISDTNSEL